MKSIKKPGIYTITNIINNKVYVGNSIRLLSRGAFHFSSLKYGRHSNPYLQSAYNKYGKDNFKYEILEECDEEFLPSQENYWCRLLDTHDRRFGYNIRPTSPFDTRPLYTEEMIEKCRRWHLGRKASDLSKERMRQAKIGVPRSPEVIERMHQWCKGQTISEKHKQALRLLHRGSNHRFAVLTESMVIEIRKMQKEGIRRAVIIEKLKITVNLYKSAITNWKYLN